MSLAGESEVIEAVDAARAAQPGWAGLDLWERARILQKVSDLVRSRAQPLKELITREMGRPLFESDIEVNETADMLKYFANEGKTALDGESPVLDSTLFPHKLSMNRYEPLGVIGVIKPWNYPFELPFWSIGAALLSGNTVVFKPSELTPQVGMEIGRVCQDAGIPAGVVNVVTGDDSTGRLLVKSDVDAISFTGSTKAGQSIFTESGDRLHKLSLELGGSDPFIVFADANLPQAIAGAVWGRYANCGQVCTAAKRFIVHASVYDSFLDGLVGAVQKLRIGDGLDPSTDLGPLVSKAQRDNIENIVTDAVKKGAVVKCGGRVPPSHHKGFFYEPSILTNVTATMRALSEEVFGPVATVQSFGTEDEAVRLANDTVYGLGASVWSSTLHTAVRVANSLRCGMVWVNDINVAYPNCPWGGTKYSGIGRELSRHGIREFANIKHINIDYGGEPSRPWWYPYKR